MHTQGLLEDENIQICFECMKPMNELLSSSADLILGGTEASETLFTEQKSKFEIMLQKVRLSLWERELNLANPLDPRETVEFVFCLQVENFTIVQTISNNKTPTFTFKDNVMAFLNVRKLHFFASVTQLRSAERIIASLKFAVMTALAQFFTYEFPQVFTYGKSSKIFYMSLTVALLASVENNGSSILKSVNRLIGTGVGGSYILFVFLLPNGQIASIYFIMMLAVWSLVASYLQRNLQTTKYAAFVLGITPIFLSMEDTTFFDTKALAINTIIIRLLNTFVGAFMVILTSWLFLFTAKNKLHVAATSCLDCLAFSLHGLLFDGSKFDMKPLGSSLALVSSLVGPSASEPSLWNVPFNAGLFSNVNMQLCKLVQCLDQMATMLRLADDNPNNWVYGNLINLFRGVENNASIVLHGLGTLFKDPKHRQGDFDLSQGMTSVLTDFDNLKRDILISKDELKEKVKVGGDLNDESELRLTMKDELDADFAFQAISLNALVHQMFELRDCLKAVATAVEEYLVEFDYLPTDVALPLKIPQRSVQSKLFSTFTGDV